MEYPLVLSAFTVGPLLNALEKGYDRIEISPDLGLTKVWAYLENKDFVLLGPIKIEREVLQRIFNEPQSCFLVEEQKCEKIAFYSEYTSRYYSLYPTSSAPTMLLSGIPMHRIKDTNPHTDTLTKIKASQPSGLVLDTTTGLGYTAIEAAKTSQNVITIELDSTVIDLCKLNPWSKDLFENPRISKVIGDTYDLISVFPTNYFSCIIHDPPTFSLAGDLYSGEFYAQVYRVLKQKGRFFHYIGDLTSPSGRKVLKGVSSRLQDVGFNMLSIRPEAFGILAQKK